MKVFSTYEVAAAVSHSVAGGQAMHLHTIIPDRRRAPQCFVRAVDRGEPIAHLFDMNRQRLIATAKKCGVNVIHIDRDGTSHQHIDLCGAPLRRCYKLLDAGQCDALQKILDGIKPDSEQPSLPLTE